MPRYHPTGHMAVAWVPTVASAVFLPTAAEIAAGTRLQTYALRDGVTTPSSGNTIDASDISSLFNSTAPGTYGGNALELVCHRGSAKDASDDVAWTTLARLSIGFIVLARSGFAQPTNGLGTPSGTATIGDRCECYPVTVISREMQKTGDETSRFVAMLAITSTPNDSATLAA